MAENRQNHRQAQEEGRRADQQQRSDDETPQRHSQRVGHDNPNRSEQRHCCADVSVEQ